ncbi:hypothetical protein BGX24_006016, partial [Mortierella sp. AD032]
MANQNLVLRVGHPGLGAGQDVLSLRSDCEAGSYCDYSQGGVKGQGLCKEQYPLYHSCKSYLECISLRCDTSDGSGSASAPASAIVVVADGVVAEPRGRQKQRRDLKLKEHRRPDGVLKNNDKNNKLVKRRFEPVCLPPKPQTPGGGNGSNESTGSGSGDSKDSPVFPHWAYALITVLIVVGAGLVFVLTRRRRRREDGSSPRKNYQGRRTRQQYEGDKIEHGAGNGGRSPPMVARERERTMSSDRTAISSGSGGGVEGDKNVSLVASSVLGKWFKGSNRNSTNSNADDGKVIDLEKREGGKKTVAGSSKNNNNKSESGFNDNGSVYSSSNSTFTIDEHQQEQPSVPLNVPQDDSSVGRHHVDSDCPDDHGNSHSHNIHLGDVPSIEVKSPSSPVHSGSRPAIVLPRIITTSFPESTAGSSTSASAVAGES